MEHPCAYVVVYVYMCVCIHEYMCGGQRSTLGVFLNHSLLHLFQLLRGVATAPMWLSEDNVISPPLPLLPGSWRWNPLLGLHSQAPLVTSPEPPCFLSQGLSLNW